MSIKNQIRAEIERRKNICEGVFERDSDTYYQGKAVAYQETLSFLDSIPEQERSEEDVDMLNLCISSIEEAKENRYAYKETDGDTSYDHEIDWLKSLRPQPKQEWSEEDIKKIRSEEYTKGFNDAAFGGKLKEWSVEDEDRIRQIERIAQQAGCTQKLQEEIHDWLKSLRPQWQNG